MCFYSSEIKNADRNSELSLQEIDKIAFHFKNLPYLSITGGEPTLRTDLSEIISLFYKRSRTRNINISTNGLNPSAIEDVVNVVIERHPYLQLKVSISLDGVNEIHNRIRNFKGAFDLAMESYRKIESIRNKTTRLSIYITTVLTPHNSSYIFETIDFIKNNLKVDGHNICIVRGKTREPMEIPPLHIYEKAVKRVIRNMPLNINNLINSMMYEVNISVLKRNGFYIPCQAGRKMLVISENGTVRPCEVLKDVLPDIDDTMGNLRDYGYNIEKVLSSSRARGILKNIKEKYCACTFECANMCNVIFNYRYIPGLIRKIWISRLYP